MQRIYGWQVDSTAPADVIVHPPVRDVSELPSTFHDILTGCPPPSDWVECYSYGQQHLVVHYYHPAGSYYYIIDWASSEIWMLSLADNLVDTYSLLMGTVMSLVSRLRGRLTLHGTVIDINGRVAALLADKGIGKSTTSMGLLQRDHAVLSDDVVSISAEEGFMVYPGLPQVRQTLYTLLAFGLSPGNYSPIFKEVPVEKQDKRIIPLGIDHFPRFQPQPMPLDAVYLLNRDRVAQPQITALNQLEALQKTLQHISFTPHAVMHSEFQLVSTLISATPVRQLSFPPDLTQLDLLCQTLEADLDALPQQAQIR